MRSLGLLLVFTLFFSGCSNKKYFEPTQAFSASNATQNYGGKILGLSRDGGTLQSGTYVGRDGISSINLGQGYRFLNESKSYVLVANPAGILKIISKKNNKIIRSIDLHVPVVSASIKNGLIAYILNNNAFGLYKMKNNEKLIESRSERSFAVDTRAASPLFIDNLVVMPMLDGKLIILDSRNTENSKVVYMSNQSIFNNVIYLSRINNTLVASTPKRIITLGGAGKREFNANISEVAVSKNHIYLFTKEGEIISLNNKLEKLHASKFKFAHFAVGTAFDGKVYALDQQGSLIVANSTLDKYRVYKLGAISQPAFITGARLYKDGKIIALSKLGYE